MKIISIHQPNFFPWLGYFNKIIRSDAFIFLDDVQFPKKGGVWTNRVKVIVSGKDKWITGAVNRDYQGTRNVNQMEFDNSKPWKDKMIKSIQMNYGKHPFYDETMPLLESLILNKEDIVSEYNIRSIKKICYHLGIKQTFFTRSSEIDYQGSSNEMLCSITKHLNGTHYMAGSGAVNYEDQNVYEAHKISLIRQNFNHPIYPQKGMESFISGLSIIDVLMNVGKNKCMQLLQ